MKPGHQIRDYILEQMIGEGGMGTVWCARHRLLDKKVAIKVMAERVLTDPEFGLRFLQEAKAQAKLQHPRIVGVTDFFAEAGGYFLVMPLVDGESLDDRLDRLRGPLPIDEALDVAFDVLGALDYAHQRGVIHRDVKPSNILLDSEGGAHLTDFGIAILVGDERRTQTGTSMGTPHYMSPEQIRRPRGVDHRTDVYSFGCVLYEMVTGRTPFESGEGDDTDFVVKEGHVNRAPPPPRRWNPAIPDAVEAAILRALAKKPDDRFLGCGEFAAALRTAAGVPEPATRHTPVGARIAARTPAAAPHMPTPPRDDSRPCAPFRDLADLMLRAQRFEEARRAIQVALDLEPEDPGSQHLLDRIEEAVQAHRAEEARQAALRQVSVEVEGHLSREDFDGASAALDAARPALGDAAELTALQLRVAEARRKARDTAVTHLLAQASDLASAERFEEAQSRLLEARTLAPENVLVQRLLASNVENIEGRKERDRLRAALERAIHEAGELLAAGRLDEAARVVASLPTLGADATTVSVLASHVEDARAEATVSAALKEAEALAARDQLDAALARLEAARRLYPEEARLLALHDGLLRRRQERQHRLDVEVSRVGALLDSGELDEAAVVVTSLPALGADERAVRLLSDRVDTARRQAQIRASLLAGKALAAEGRFDDALAAIAAARQRFPGDSDLASLQADVARRQREAAEAEAAARAAAEAAQRAAAEAAERERAAAAARAAEEAAERQRAAERKAVEEEAARQHAVEKAAERVRAEEWQRGAIARAVARAEDHLAAGRFGDAEHAARALANLGADPGVIAQLNGRVREVRRAATLRQIVERAGALGEAGRLAEATTVAHQALDAYPGEAELVAMLETLRVRRQEAEAAQVRTLAMPVQAAAPPTQAVAARLAQAQSLLGRFDHAAEVGDIAAAEAIVADASGADADKALLGELQARLATLQRLQAAETARIGQPALRPSQTVPPAPTLKRPVQPPPTRVLPVPAAAASRVPPARQPGPAPQARADASRPVPAGVTASPRPPAARGSMAWAGVALALAALASGALLARYRHGDPVATPATPATPAPETMVAQAARMPATAPSSPQPTPPPTTILASAPAAASTDSPRPTPRPRPVAPTPAPTATPRFLPFGPPPETVPSQEMTGTLQLGIKPWAEVSVDGNAVGTSPIAAMKLAPGEHTVRLLHPDYQPLQRKVRIQPGETTSLQVDLGVLGIPR